MPLIFLDRFLGHIFCNLQCIPDPSQQSLLTKLHFLSVSIKPSVYVYWYHMALTEVNPTSLDTSSPHQQAMAVYVSQNTGTCFINGPPLLVRVTHV